MAQAISNTVPSTSNSLLFSPTAKAPSITQLAAGTTPGIVQVGTPLISAANAANGLSTSTSSSTASTPSTSGLISAPAATITRTSTAPAAAPAAAPAPQPAVQSLATPTMTNSLAAPGTTTPLGTAIPAQNTSPQPAPGGGQYINGQYYAPGAASPSTPPTGTTQGLVPPPQSTGAVLGANWQAAIANGTAALDANGNPYLIGAQSTTAPVTPPITTGAPTYPQAVGQANTQVQSNATPPGQTSTAIQNLNTATANNPLTDNSSALVTNLNQAQKDLADYQASVAARNASLANSGAAASFQYGVSSANQAADASKLDQLQSRVAAAQTALGQGLTEQSQQQSGYTSAAGASNTQQSTTQSGNSTIIGATQPIQAPYSNQVLSPTTGQSIQGSVPSPSVASAIAALPPAAQSAISSQPAAAQTAIMSAYNLIQSGAGFSNAANASSLSTFGPAAQNALLAALGPSFNTQASDAKAQANASNISTATSAVPSATAAATGNAATNYIDLTTKTFPAATQAATILANTLSSSDINKYLSTNANAAINTIAGLTSSPGYTQFVQNIDNTRLQYQALLGSLGGSTPTNLDAASADFINPNSSASTIVTGLNNLNNEIYQEIITPAYQNYQAYLNQNNANAGSSAVAPSTGANAWH